MESRAKKYEANEVRSLSQMQDQLPRPSPISSQVQEQWPRPSQKSPQVPQDSMMRNKFLASLDRGVAHPVKFLQQQNEKKGNRSSSSGCQKTSNFNTFPGRPYTEPVGSKPQQRRRSLSFT